MLVTAAALLARDTFAGFVAGVLASMVTADPGPMLRKVATLADRARSG